MSTISKFRRSKNLRELVGFLVREFLDNSDDGYLASQEFRTKMKRRYSFQREVDVLVLSSSGVINALREAIDELDEEHRGRLRVKQHIIAEIFYNEDGWRGYFDRFYFRKRNGRIRVRCLY